MKSVVRLNLKICYGPDEAIEIVLFKIRLQVMNKQSQE